VPLPPLVRSATAGAERLFDRVLCVAGAVLFSQAPEFMQQYLQRLEGHLDEARAELDNFRGAAAQAGMTLDQLISAAGRNADPAMARLAGVAQQTAARVDQLASADAALRGASIAARPFVFVAHADWGIARATLRIFRPAVPTTLEGLAYALVGVVVVLTLYHVAVRMPVARHLRRRVAARSAAPA
jgi:hypothetical protein